MAPPTNSTLQLRQAECLRRASSGHRFSGESHPFQPSELTDQRIMGEPCRSIARLGLSPAHLRGLDMRGSRVQRQALGESGTEVFQKKGGAETNDTSGISESRPDFKNPLQSNSQAAFRQHFEAAAGQCFKAVLKDVYIRALVRDRLRVVAREEMSWRRGEGMRWRRGRGWRSRRKRTLRSVLAIVIRQK